MDCLGRYHIRNDIHRSRIGFGDRYFHTELVQLPILMCSGTDVHNFLLPTTRSKR